MTSFPDWAEETNSGLPFDGHGSLNVPANLPSPKGEFAHSQKELQGAIHKKQLAPRSSQKVGIRPVHDGKPADLWSIHLDVFRKDENGLDFLILSATEPDIKKVKDSYEFTLSPVETAETGDLKVVWTYHAQVDGQSHENTFEDRYIVINSAMPHYDALSDGEKFVVEQVSWMFADLYDSMNGGPHLQEEFQTQWGLNRMAQLLNHAVTAINFTGQPTTFYGVGGRGRAVPQQFHGVLVIALYVQVLEHFVRTYVEQPMDKGVSVPILDRRDYMNRWKTVLDDKRRDLEKAIRALKRSQMGLGGGSLIVSGGIYGRGGRIHSMEGMAARAGRWYPYVPIVTVR